MKRYCLLVYLVMPVLTIAQTPTKTNAPHIESKMYSWTTPRDKESKHLRTVKLFEGSAHDMAYLKMNGCALISAKKETAIQVPTNEEHLLIVKRGSLNIAFGDSAWSLIPGSIAVLMPGQKYSVRNTEPEPVLFYRMQYRSKEPVDMKKTPTSFVRDWAKLTFTTHDRGGIRRYFETPTAMCERFEMHVTTLKPGIKSHEPHTHRAEEIVLVLEDSETITHETEMQIGDAFYTGTAGDIYYLGSNVPHAIRNRGSVSCSYFAFQFE